MCDKACECQVKTRGKIRTYEVSGRFDEDKRIGRGVLFPDGTVVHQTGEGFGDWSDSVVIHRGKDVNALERMYTYEKLTWGD